MLCGHPQLHTIQQQSLSPLPLQESQDQSVARTYSYQTQCHYQSTVDSHTSVYHPKEFVSVPSEHSLRVLCIVQSLPLNYNLGKSESGFRSVQDQNKVVQNFSERYKNTHDQVGRIQYSYL